MSVFSRLNRYNMNLRKLEYNKHKSLTQRLELPFVIIINDKSILDKVYDKLFNHNILWSNQNKTQHTNINQLIVSKYKNITHCSKSNCLNCNGLYSTGNKCNNKEHKTILDSDFIKETVII